MQDFWNLWYVTHDLRSFQDLYFTKMIFFPEGTALSYHSFAYPAMAFAALYKTLFGASLSGLIWLENAFLIVSFPISGAGAFYLVRYFAKDSFGAAVGGAIFAFNPWHVMQAMSHLHVSSTEFLPIFALSYIMAVDYGRVVYSILAALCLSLAAASCWYFLFYSAYFIAFYYCYSAAVARKAWLTQHFLPMAVCGVGSLVLLSPLLVPMVLLALAKGGAVYAAGGDRYVVDLVSYVTFPPLHLLSELSSGIRWRLAGNEADGRTAYLGLVNLVLLVWLVLRRKPEDRRVIGLVLSGLIVFCILASGEHLRIFGYRVLPMPDFLLDRLPFFQNVRTPSRAMVYVYLFLGIGVGYAVSSLVRSRQSQGERVALSAVLVVLIGIDFMPFGLTATPVDCPLVYRQLAFDGDHNFGILELPSEWPAPNAYMMWQHCHGRPIVMGFVSRKLDHSLADALIVDDLERQREQLINAHVKYVVIHNARDKLFRWGNADGSETQYLDHYETVYEEPGAKLLRVY
jgi:hypothetical protein